jgi:hypothetical protein
VQSSGPNYLDKPGFDPKACPMTGEPGSLMA